MAGAGDLKEFTGISAPSSELANPDLVIDTDQQSLEKSVDQVLRILINSGTVSKQLWAKSR